MLPQVDEPTLEELEALQDLEPGEEERDALDFRSEDRFGPQERGTARRSQGINYVSTCASWHLPAVHARAHARR